MARSKNGWIRINRDILNSTIWNAPEPFTYRDAWIDLILMVNFEDREIVTRHGTVVKIPRGATFTSLQELSDRWHWSKGRTQRYIKLLKNLKMVTADGTADGTLLSLVNYDKFQGARYADGTANDTADGPSDGPADGPRIKKEKEREEGKNTRRRARTPTLAEKMAAIEERRQRLIREEQERLKGEQQNDGD